jgi:hypothetical protein
MMAFAMIDPKRLRSARGGSHGFFVFMLMRTSSQRTQTKKPLANRARGLVIIQATIPVSPRVARTRFSAVRSVQ